jgi:hypothetical protein
MTQSLPLRRASNAARVTFDWTHLTLVKGLPAGSTASLGRAIRTSTEHMETGARQATGA